MPMLHWNAIQSRFKRPEPAALWRRLSLRRKLYTLSLMALAPSLLLLGQVAVSSAIELRHAQRRLGGLRSLELAEGLQGAVEAGLEDCRAGRAPDSGALGPLWSALRARVQDKGDAALTDALERLDGDWST